MDGKTALFVGGVRYSGADLDLRLDVLRPAERPVAPRPMVLYVHGGGWRSGNRGEAMLPWLSPHLVNQGYVTASMTYRLSDEACWPAPLDDVRAAVRWLRRNADALDGDPSRIGLWGYSAGAQLAAMAALTAPAEDAVQAVAVFACPADLRSRTLTPDSSVTALLGSTAAPEALEAISPVCQVSAGAPPFLVVQASADELVPTSTGALLCQRLRDVGTHVELVSIEDEDHEWLGRPPGRGAREAEAGFGALALRFFDAQLR